MDLDALREALDEWDDTRLVSRSLRTILAAARAVLDSERIWWCNADRAEWPEDDEFGEYCAHDSERGCGFVFVVRVRLLAEDR